MSSNEVSWNAFSSLLLRHTVTGGAYTTYSTNELHPSMYNWPSPQLHGLQAYQRLKSITPQEQIVAVILQVGYMKWLCRYHQLWRWLTTGATSAQKLFRKFTYKFCVYFTTQGQPANSGLWDHIQKQQVTCTVCTKCRICECKAREEISRE